MATGGGCKNYSEVDYKKIFKVLLLSSRHCNAVEMRMLTAFECLAKHTGV